ncbi:hypothetical protein FisN_5Hh371 [Fistulifera solaris]|uniref:Pseudouridine synthase RsuA/RluA-like domain-containing protein n=1 Tax=Fistulifera solaris TaxID=1519565 RepID=A0A1Z5JT03_FISSO|nr:hypothetical protein FisN_5Hh371 [Fistulifera solaris]|eukprot:GAX16992.1 hypothetical protein FisN_5Hh371 [Fistulifera solaris]
MIHSAYERGETDAVLNLNVDLQTSPITPAELVSQTFGTFASKRGQAASILNACLGLCCFQNNTSYAHDLWNEWQHLADESGIQPDIVTMCLVYTCLLHGNDEMQAVAESILDLAVRNSKKQAGSKRRKSMAAARRKAEATSAASVESQLQDILGSDFRVLLETEHMFIISKPSGIACFHKHSTTAGKVKKGKGNADVSLEEALLHVNLPLSTINSEARGLVHRLDRGTSGCLAIAKSDGAHAQLVTEFFLRQVSKKYFCLVSPSVQWNSQQETPILIDSPVSGHVAQSKYRVMKSFDEASLVEMETLTGRKHQVRVHAAEVLKSPIIGDPLYGGDGSFSNKLIQHAGTPHSFFLHAASIQIPFSGGERIEAPIPEWWSSALNTL